MNVRGRGSVPDCTFGFIMISIRLAPRLVAPTKRSTTCRRVRRSGHLATPTARTQKNTLTCCQPPILIFPAESRIYSVHLKDRH